MTQMVIQGRYAIAQELGKKAGKKTLLARDLETNTLVVLKVLHFNRVGERSSNCSSNQDLDWQVIRLFEREAETLKSLAHPDIPRYLDFFSLDTPELRGFVLVQTYLPGQSLQALLNTGQILNERAVTAIARSLLQILIYLQSRNPPVIHRDIKPSNVMLDPATTLESLEHSDSDAKIFLVDFGAVQTVAPGLNQTVTVVGTYGYMPPEQFGGQAVPASDLYSLGATLITLLTGKHPAELPQKNLRIQFQESLSHPLSTQFHTWLTQLIEPTLERRFSSAQVALTALDHPLLTQPPDSRIVLRKTAHFIDITIPYGQKTGLTFLGLGLVIVWNVVVLLVFILLSFGGAIAGLVGARVFLMAMLGVGVYGLVIALYDCFGEVKLRIDHHEITRRNSLFGYNHDNPKASSSLRITGVEQQRLKVIIRAPGLTYELNGDRHLSSAEVEWLTQELKTWLGK